MQQTQAELSRLLEFVRRDAKTLRRRIEKVRLGLEDTCEWDEEFRQGAIHELSWILEAYERRIKSTESALSKYAPPRLELVVDNTRRSKSNGKVAGPEGGGAA